jgi:hypothetical protein
LQIFALLFVSSPLSYLVAPAGRAVRNVEHGQFLRSYTFEFGPKAGGYKYKLHIYDASFLVGRIPGSQARIIDFVSTVFPSEVVCYAPLDTSVLLYGTESAYYVSLSRLLTSF